jgi:DNA-binding PadR family transcriptional regulator
MSDPTLLVLSSLAESDRHGYAIMQDVEAFAGIKLGPGTLYGAITRLEERGWIKPVGAKERRQAYRITSGGREHLQTELSALRDLAKTGLARLKHA